MENQDFVTRNRSVIKFIVFVFCVVGLIFIWAKDNIKEKHRMQDETFGRLTVSGYSNIKILKGKTNCKDGRYGVYYLATNPKGEKERGLVCVPNYGETGYISPTMIE